MSDSENTCLYELAYRMVSSTGTTQVAEATGQFFEDRLEIRGLCGSIRPVSFRDIAELQATDYRILLSMTSGESLEISQLGYHYEAFVAALTDRRNALAREDLLIREKLLFTAEDVQFGHFSPGGACLSEGPCHALVSDTALILAMPDTMHLKFPLSYALRVEDVDYTLVITMESGEIIRLSMLGRQREPLMLNLEKAIGQLLEHALELCRELFPGTAEAVLKETAPFFRDGRAVSKASLDAISPHLWQVMESKLGPCGIDYSYTALKALGDGAQCVIGIKRGLMGELTGEYVWLMIPLPYYSLLALEAGMTDGTGGQATYLFKMPPSAQTPEGMEQFISLINDCFYRVNFRREPVYLTEEQLTKPAFDHYRYAILKVPALRLLRTAFAGRVLHTTEERWRKELETQLKAGRK